MQNVIPEKLVITQPNISELVGDIWGSFNLDLASSLGRIKIGLRTKKISSDADSGLSTLVRPMAFIRTSARGSDEWWVLCNQKMLYSNANADPRTPFIVDATANSPTTNLLFGTSDMDEFSGDLVVSLIQNLSKLSGGTWTASWWQTTLGQRALVNSLPHPVKTVFNNLFLVGDQVAVNNEAGKGEKAGQASVHAIDIASNVSLNRLIFKKSQKVSFILTSDSEVWIGLSHTGSGKAEMIYWDGNSINFNRNYKISDTTLFSGVIDDEGIPCVVDGKGRLLRFNGKGFKEIARFPVANSKYYRWTGDALNKNGMCLVDGKINMLISAGLSIDSKGLLENMPSGIWEFDENIGLYHKHGVTNTQSAGVLDFGSPTVRRVGALIETEKRYGTVLGGCELSTDNDTALVNLIFALDNVDTSFNVSDTVLKTGFFITRKFSIAGLEEHWEKMALKFSKFLNSTDKVYIKYRTDFKNYLGGNYPGNYKGATWKTTTTFDSASSQTWTDVSVGDEVFIMSGKGAGVCAKITAISLAGSTYTITLDYTFTGIADGDLLLVQVRNWSILALNTSQDYLSNQTLRYQDLNIGANASEIQFKVVMFGKGDSPEINALHLRSVENESLNK